MFGMATSKMGFLELRPKYAWENRLEWAEVCQNQKVLFAIEKFVFAASNNWSKAKAQNTNTTCKAQNETEIARFRIF